MWYTTFDDHLHCNVDCYVSLYTCVVPLGGVRCISQRNMVRHKQSPSKQKSSNIHLTQQRPSQAARYHSRSPYSAMPIPNTIKPGPLSQATPVILFPCFSQPEPTSFPYHTAMLIIEAAGNRIEAALTKRK